MREFENVPPGSGLGDPDTDARGIVLFDGVCSLCNGFVDFLIRRDRQARLLFGTLQSDRARELLEGQDVEIAEGLATVVLVTEHGVLVRSDAALRTLELLGGRWRWVGKLRVLPRPLRDAVYRLVAKHRYRIFGRRDSCRLPTPDEARRFIDG